MPLSPPSHSLPFHSPVRHPPTHRQTPWPRALRLLALDQLVLHQLALRQLTVDPPPSHQPPPHPPPLQSAPPPFALPHRCPPPLQAAPRPFSLPRRRLVGFLHRMPRPVLWRAEQWEILAAELSPGPPRWPHYPPPSRGQAGTSLVHTLPSAAPCRSWQHNDSQFLERAVLIWKLHYYGIYQRG